MAIEIGELLLVAEEMNQKASERARQKLDSGIVKGNTCERFEIGKGKILVVKVPYSQTKGLGLTEYRVNNQDGR